jgi:adenylate cyclase
MSAVIYYSSKGVSTEVPCEAVLTLGRDKSSDIPIADLLVSRNHAMIRRFGQDDYYIIDSGSSNGSFVNSHRVTIPRLLKNGDCIQIGDQQFVFKQQKELTSTAAMDTISMEATIISERAEIRKVTVLVADIRGFTSLSENIDIRILTKMMTNWFHSVTDVIGKHGGVIDKFIGDCVFALWESDLNEARSVKSALQAAIDINAVTEALNNPEETTKRLRIGAGINTGIASMGIGQDATALGDAVNIAFRLESATKVLGVDVVMSESSYSSVSKDCPLGEKKYIKVKGKRDKLKICGLHFDEVKKMLENFNSTLIL